MQFGCRVVLSFLGAFALSGLSVAHAQQPSWGLSVSGSRVDYDLSGVGSTAGVAVRATRALSPHVSLELRSLFAQPRQQFGSSTLFAPEAQLQYRWNAGRLEPYVGAGLGTSALKSSFHTEWDPTVSFAAGTGVRLTERVALTGEFRLRGHELRFTGTTTEISAGVSWRLSSF